MMTGISQLLTRGFGTSAVAEMKEMRRNRNDKKGEMTRREKRQEGPNDKKGQMTRREK